MNRLTAKLFLLVCASAFANGAPVPKDKTIESDRNLRTSIGRDGSRGGTAGGQGASTYGRPERRYFPSSSPTAEISRCNICGIPDTSVSLGSAQIQFGGAPITCAELQQMDVTGEIPEESCEQAQASALENCGCIVNNGFTTGDIPSTCPPVAGLTQDEQDWLDVHNSRREFWHKYYNVDFVELCWDTELASQAQFYANYLADNCLREHDSSKPDPNGYQKCRRSGESLAFDTYQNSDGRSATEIIYSWIDKEFTASYPYDGHLTQALWRPSRFLGCARAVGPGCYWKNIQVCRYVRPGNCNCGGSTCRDAMLEDSSLCGTEEVEVSLEEYIDCFEDYHGI